ncbi:MAG: Mu-like prophage major head subunit gpT family protein [Nitrospirae bacterium]|nr:Mu-like prophage major head subunit gpT family protein [Nitrospirota bacterium]
MIINQANITSLYRGFSAVFKEAFETASALYPRIATEVPSASRQEEYNWLGRVPRMREWLGERVIQNLSAYSYTIKNRDWEATVAVDRNDVEDDAVGIYTPMVRALADASATHPDELVFDLLAGGFVNLCYDGRPFFDTAHPTGDRPAQSNKATAALSATSYAAARAAMMSLVDESGKPLNVVPDLLVVPPQLEKAALEVLRADLTADGTSNIYKNSADLVVAPYLAGSPDAWYLLDTKKPVKPFIFQRRKAAVFVSKDTPEDEGVFMKKEFLFGVDSRDNAGYGLWQLAYASDGSV